ncbi:hypothetical protein C366_04576 [Cryptococcus neoformans Tu401-1]|nr:hypothetical protein C366_04576 [Cryptococcus neoformans var. grubii Tu401-1]OXM77622.1 hypothetical protein C364_04560 [Cryptococcus neoformans var. grubii Bt63]
MSPTSRKVTVENASSSPTPPPTEAPSRSTEAEHADKAESASGSESEGEWDPSAEILPGGADESKRTRKGKDHDGGKGESSEKGEEQPWQAVWSPEQNAYYFWNTITGEVTWTNPLQPQTSTQPPLPNEPPPLPSGPVPVPQESHPEFEQFPDIDPALSHLIPPSQRGFGMPADATLTQRAAFNSRTGKFTPQDYYSPEHLSEYNRAKRMNSHYFDVEAWERQKAEESAKRRREEEEGGSSKKKISKKDMDRFRKKAAERKARSQAWLRE